MDRFSHIKFREKNPDPEYYNKDVKRLKAKVRRVYNKRKLGEQYQWGLKRLKNCWQKKKKLHRKHFCGQYCSEFYMYMKRRKGNREIIPAIKDHSGTIITESTGKADILNSYCRSAFCCDHNISKIQLASSGETFIIDTKIMRKRLAKIGRNKSVGQMEFLVKL